MTDLDDFYEVDVISRMQIRSPVDLDRETLKAVARIALDPSRTENSVTGPFLKYPVAVKVTDVDVEIVE